MQGFRDLIYCSFPLFSVVICFIISIPKALLFLKEVYEVLDVTITPSTSFIIFLLRCGAHGNCSSGFFLLLLVVLGSGRNLLFFRFLDFKSNSLKTLLAVTSNRPKLSSSSSEVFISSPSNSAYAVSSSVLSSSLQNFSSALLSTHYSCCAYCSRLAFSCSYLYVASNHKSGGKAALKNSLLRLRQLNKCSVSVHVLSTFHSTF